MPQTFLISLVYSKLKNHSFYASYFFYWRLLYSQLGSSTNNYQYWIYEYIRFVKTYCQKSLKIICTYIHQVFSSIKLSLYYLFCPAGPLPSHSHPSYLQSTQLCNCINIFCKNILCLQQLWEQWKQLLQLFQQVLQQFLQQRLIKVLLLLLVLISL